MRAQIHECPRPGDRCVLTAWPTGSNGRKLFANTALIDEAGEILAVAQSTWVMVDASIEPG
jgi:acyl-CoA thioesterase FadM